MTQLLEISMVHLIISVLLSFIGRERRIGYSWSLFFNIFLGPIIALIIMLKSPKNKYQVLSPSISRKIWGWIFIALFSFMIIVQAYQIIERQVGFFQFIFGFFILVGPVGLGYYLVTTSKGINYNSDKIHNKNE